MKIITIGTHSGSFHADDVFAVAALTILYPTYEIVRSRDPEVWAQCDFLLDVGGYYDHEKRVYDHHFKDGPAYSDGLKMSSVGLIWKHYGNDICGGNCNVADRVCNLLIRALDANDNGVTLSTPLKNVPDVREVSLAGTVALMNPLDRTLADAAFASEVVRARDILRASILNARHWLEAHSEVEASVQKALRENKPYIEISEGCPWSEHLFNCSNNKSILYTIYPHGEKWYVRTVPVEPGSFDNRKSLPQSWGGLRDDEFSAAAGIPDGVFCHHGCFICAAGSYNSAVQLALSAFNSPE